tara:strand:+ start:2509 stop:3399 length:891 start_codon:yes stop_codon:yes gene_type:complete
MSFWQGLFPGGNPEGGIEGSLPFRFENFGTFAGPQASSTNYNYDKISQELLWPNFVPGDYAFKNVDLGAYLYNNEFNYVGFHCDGVSTAQMYLQHSAGNIPIFNILADTTNVLGNVNAVGNINATGNITALGNITATGNFSFNGPMQLTGVGDVATKILAVEVVANGKKGFDIPHPSKDGHRLRYICLEGPDAEVYLRGKLKGDNTIELPHVWRDLVDLESIGVTLTPIGCYQELFVEKIQWGTQITVKNNLSGPINCSYVVYGTRKDTQRNIPEYEGLTIDDYPGDNREYNINGL